MKTIKKLWALGLCGILVINMNSMAYADVLDDIIGSSTIEDTEDAENTEDVYTDVDNEDVTGNDITVTDENIAKYSVLFSDIDNHWAKEWIKNAVGLGFVSGYEDGTFKPDRTITRAEFSTMLNKAMKIEITENINFSDVREKEWFYKEIQKSVAAGFFSGYENNTFRPNNPIKREEVAKVVAGAITTGNIDGEGATLLKDYSTIQEWAKDSVILLQQRIHTRLSRQNVHAF